MTKIIEFLDSVKTREQVALNYSEGLVDIVLYMEGKRYSQEQIAIPTLGGRRDAVDFRGISLETRERQGEFSTRQ